MKCRISANVLETLLAEAALAYPEECCGILLGEEQRIAKAVCSVNVHPDPLGHFEIDPQTLIDAHRAARNGSPDVVGYYHSHPTGLAEPSATDRALASGDGHIWAIIGNGDVTFWLDDEDGFVNLPYKIDGR